MDSLLFIHNRVGFSIICQRTRNGPRSKPVGESSGLLRRKARTGSGISCFSLQGNPILKITRYLDFFHKIDYNFYYISVRMYHGPYFTRNGRFAGDFFRNPFLAFFHIVPAKQKGRKGSGTRDEPSY